MRLLLSHCNVRAVENVAVNDDICTDKQTMEGSEDWYSWFSMDD